MWKCGIKQKKEEKKQKAMASFKLVSYSLHSVCMFHNSSYVVTFLNRQKGLWCFMSVLSC